MKITQSWSKLYQYRRQIKERYPKIWNLKIIKKHFKAILQEVGDGDKVLEIGAYNRSLKEEMKNYYPNASYSSMDIDRETDQDYYSLDEVKEIFNIILLFEVIEHLTFPEGEEMLKKIAELLKPGGRLILTTPNLYHPNWYWGDATHRTPYRYDEIGGVLLGSGYRVRHIYRVHNDAFFQKIFRLLLMPLHKYLDSDFAKSILIIAERE
ncbi:class I SAM-dependent methyltransferase [candidate division NPL-UPA2 bacterium]|nr:class I SAM-dependent methyltransferase [candidate division NPL-UPA2 bacterium]